MSGGAQHRSWAMKPKNQALTERVRGSHFHHVLPGGYGLTYQSCRFCGLAGYQSEDRDVHSSEGHACEIRKRVGDVCRGLWKYSVRHYICATCRTRVLAGSPPQKRKAVA